MRAPDEGVLLITHYQRLLDYVEPDRVHVLRRRPHRRSGGPELALELEREGYAEARRMTAPFPTRRQEEWRYADLEALQPVWEQFAEPVTLTVAAGEHLEEIWLPSPTTFRLRRVQIGAWRRRDRRAFSPQYCTGLRPHRT